MQLEEIFQSGERKVAMSWNFTPRCYNRVIVTVSLLKAAMASGLAAARLIISEFQAANTTTIQDGTGSTSTA
jgi:hypothetical protein